MEMRNPAQLPHDDRRDSPRVPMRFWVRRAGTADAHEEREGDLSLGGFASPSRSPLEPGAHVDVRFQLPDVPGELVCRGEVIRTSEKDGGARVHVRFLDLPEEQERSIARYLDGLKLGGASS